MDIWFLGRVVITSTSIGIKHYLEHSGKALNNILVLLHLCRSNNTWFPGVNRDMFTCAKLTAVK